MIRAGSILLVVLSTCMSDISLPQDPASNSPPVECLSANKHECPELAEVEGAVINVQPGESRQLPCIVANASPSTTILLAHGTYTMTGSESERRMIFSVPKVILRSASGHRDKVIIDGDPTRRAYQTLALTSAF